MKNYTEKKIESLIKRFEARKLPKSEWTHEAHLVTAVWYLSKYNFEHALSLLRLYIASHNEAVGTPNTDTEGYHETITRFWLLVTNNFLENKTYNSIADACNGLINSEFGTSDYPLKYYNKTTLFSTYARHNWVQPENYTYEKILNGTAGKTTVRKKVNLAGFGQGFIHKEIYTKGNTDSRI